MPSEATHGMLTSNCMPFASGSNMPYIQNDIRAVITETTIATIFIRSALSFGTNIKRMMPSNGKNVTNVSI